MYALPIRHRTTLNPTIAMSAATPSGMRWRAGIGARREDDRHGHERAALWSCAGCTGGELSNSSTLSAMELHEM